MREHAQERIGDVDDRKDDGRNDRRDDDEYEHEARTAARMEPALLPDVLHGQILPCLIAEDGLVLRAVVFERAADVLHMRHRPHEHQKDRDAHDALEHVSRQHAPVLRNKAAEKARQQQEQADRQRDADDRGQAEDHPVQLFRAELRLEPLFEFRRLLIDALIVEKLRRIVDGHDAVLHGGEQRVRAAQDGQAPERRLMMRGLGLGDQLAARLAHDGAGLFRPLHDDALDDGLTADGCFLG